VKLEAVSSLVGVDITLGIWRRFWKKTKKTEMSANHDFIENINFTRMPSRKLKNA
jgi:hypothetical protein